MRLIFRNVMNMVHVHIKWIAFIVHEAEHYDATMGNLELIGRARSAPCISIPPTLHTNDDDYYCCCYCYYY